MLNYSVAELRENKKLKKTPDECSCNSSQLHSSCLITHYEAKNNTILNYSSATSHGSTKRYGSDERQKAEKFQP